MHSGGGKEGISTGPLRAKEAIGGYFIRKGQKRGRKKTKNERWGTRRCLEGEGPQFGIAQGKDGLA